MNLRQQTYHWVEGNSTLLARLVNLSITLLIFANVAAVVIESVHEIYIAYQAEFFIFEWVSVALFAVEYLIRLWIAPENPEYAGEKYPRWSWATSGMAVIDFLAIAPFFFALLVPIDTRILRVFRLLRVFKLTRYSASMELLVTVIRKEGSSFGSALFIMMILIIFAASSIYVVERDSQPTHFGSIPAALWWATVTLTTVGYGDVVPVTPMGRALGMLITVAGVGMAALPAGILASGFSRELALRREKYERELLQALKDGELDAKEISELAEARKELGIEEEEADLLMTRSTNQEERHHCPHCGESLR